MSSAPLLHPPTLGRSHSQLHATRRAASFDVHELYCLLAVVLGGIGFALTVVAAEDEACGVVSSSTTSYREGMLTRWPSTISELNSDWHSARGRLFFGFMLSTAALLFASRMPYELDNILLEETASTEDSTEDTWDESVVCCCADCGPACDWPCSLLWSGSSGCWLLDRAATLHSDCKAGTSRALGQEQEQEQQNSSSGDGGGGGSSGLCCAGSSCSCANWALLHARGIVVPLGVTFVALCPTVNFWTTELPGAQVVRAVHLTAAGVLFCGGTACEALRLYFLWCQSRKLGRQRQLWQTRSYEVAPQLRDGGGGGGGDSSAGAGAGAGGAINDDGSSHGLRAALSPAATPPSSQIDQAQGDSESCWRFVQPPGEGGPAAAGGGEGLGPLRPWLVGCLVLSIVAFMCSFQEASSITEFRLQAQRGDVLLSPVVRCPAPRLFRLFWLGVSSM
jgi:hypothetical protein